MKSKFIVIVFVLLILIGGGLFLKFQYDHSLQEIQQKTMEYLVKDKNYKESDIKKVESVHTKGGDIGVLVKVTFVDEPETEYSYQSYNGKIIQIEVNGERKAYPKSKHVETNNSMIKQMK